MAGTEQSISNTGGQPDSQQLYARLLLIRRCEERLMALFADGEVPGFIHLSIGQEAISVGIMASLYTDDTIASTHRGHAHAIAKGMPLDGFFAELLARDTGVCRGRGGSMHVADMTVGMLGANGIVGAGLPIALGSALAHKLAGSRRIAVAFFGDGALAEGVLHETANIAKLWQLPILFVCEANGWSEFSPVKRQIGFDLAEWSHAFALPFHRVDGNDARAVASLAQDVVARIRDGGGPVLLECTTSRIRGHFEGDAQKYRPENEEIRGDPLQVTLAQMLAEGIGGAEIDAIHAQVEASIDTALTAARAAPAASFADARADVYTVGAA